MSYAQNSSGSAAFLKKRQDRRILLAIRSGDTEFSKKCLVSSNNSPYPIQFLDLT